MPIKLVHFVFFLLLFVKCFSLKDKDNYKDQHCTDPRTMAKHGAYTEWADAYSCTRHRCQPGGKSLAIYTVGCKRVEAPESAIECEEVVEDTNMQFPYCCTRLRCLVVVRGEVWTKVFGQPWEVLPAAPWSHMYKMKKPPPSDREFVDKPIAAGPVYEIGSDLDTAAGGYNTDKETHTMRAKSTQRRDEDYGKMRRSNSAPPPDIVIALETNNNDYQDHKKGTGTRSKRPRAQAAPAPPAAAPEYLEDTEVLAEKRDDEEEQFGERDHAPISLEASETNYKPSNLQDLVDAIGTRMRDIENVVQKMAEKVPKKKPDADRQTADNGYDNKRANYGGSQEFARRKKPKTTSTTGDIYKRFSLRKRGDSKYVKRANADVTSEGPLYVEDRVNGYYSDSANLLIRKEPKEPVQSTYMAPVDSRRKNMQYQAEPRMPMSDADLEREQESKRKKHAHKRRRSKNARSHRRQRKDKRKLNKIGSIEADRNIVSIEDGGSASHVIL